MKKFIKSKMTLQVMAATLITTLAVVGVVAATTIGTNISTDGTLTANATSTITVNGTKALMVRNESNAPIFEVDTTNSRASTTAIIIPQANATTPRFNASSTAVSIGDGSPVAKFLFGVCSVNPPSIAVGTSSLVSTSCGATGVTSGDTVFLTPPSDETSDDNWLVFEGATASTTADNYIEITLFNASTTAAIDGSARTWKWMAIR
ncbi:MAG: hypothetical protein WC323_03975 [Patescibacteria group bacterium]|jgi:hypothetical protein